MRSLFLILLFCCYALASPANAQSTARERAKQQLALRAAAQRIVDALEAPAEIGEADARTLVGELSARMQKEVAKHSDPKDSRTLCIDVLADQRRKQLEDVIHDTIDRARANSALPLTREDVLSLLGSDWQQRVASESKAYASRTIDATFSQARKQSVALQRDALKGNIPMPPEAELNSRLNKLAESTRHYPPVPADLDHLTDWLASFVAPSDRPLFQEVRASARDAATRVVQQVKQQYEKQLGALKKAATSLPAPAIDADSIRAALLKAVEDTAQAAKQQQAQTPADERTTIYAPLAVITSEAQRMAGSLEEERLSAAIRDQKDVPLAPEDVESAMRDELKMHRDPAESGKRLTRAYTDKLQPWFAERLAERAARKGDAAFMERMQAQIAQNKRLATAAEDTVGSKLNSMLPTIRDRIAAEQVQTVFGDTPDTIESLPVTAVEALWSAGLGDAAKALEDAWKALGLAGVLADETPKDLLIDEARRAVINTSNRLVPTAVRAMREQANQLDGLEADWIGKLNKDVEAARPVEKILEDWTQELQRRWRDYAEKATLPYPDLFPRTQDLLDKTVRKLYESREAVLEAQAEEAVPEEEPVEETPEEEPVDETTSETVEELLETLDFVLYFRDTGGKHSEALLLSNEETPQRVTFAPGDVQNAVDTVYASIRSAIEDAVRVKASQTRQRGGLLALFQGERSVELKVAVLVGSREVRYMTSILLRNRVQLFVDDWNANPANPTLELEWEDNLEVAQ